MSSILFSTWVVSVFLVISTLTSSVVELSVSDFSTKSPLSKGSSWLNAFINCSESKVSYANKP